MKSSFSLTVIFLSLIYLNPVRADFQSENRINASQLNPEEKIYVPHERLHFSKDGIFVLIEND